MSVSCKLPVIDTFALIVGCLCEIGHGERAKGEGEEVPRLILKTAAVRCADRVILSQRSLVEALVQRRSNGTLNFIK